MEISDIQVVCSFCTLVFGKHFTFYSKSAMYRIFIIQNVSKGLGENNDVPPEIPKIFKIWIVPLMLTFYKWRNAHLVGLSRELRAPHSWGASPKNGIDWGGIMMGKCRLTEALLIVTYIVNCFYCTGGIYFVNIQFKNMKFWFSWGSDLRLNEREWWGPKCKFPAFYGHN